MENETSKRLDDFKDSFKSHRDEYINNKTAVWKELNKIKDENQKSLKALEDKMEAELKTTSTEILNAIKKVSGKQEATVNKFLIFVASGLGGILLVVLIWIFDNVVMKGSP